MNCEIFFFTFCKMSALAIPLVKGTFSGVTPQLVLALPSGFVGKSIKVLGNVTFQFSEPLDLSPASIVVGKYAQITVYLPPVPTDDLITNVHVEIESCFQGNFSCDYKNPAFINCDAIVASTSTIITDDQFIVCSAGGLVKKQIDGTASISCDAQFIIQDTQGNYFSSPINADGTSVGEQDTVVSCNGTAFALRTLSPPPRPSYVYGSFNTRSFTSINGTAFDLPIDNVRLAVPSTAVDGTGVFVAPYTAAYRVSLVLTVIWAVSDPAVSNTAEFTMAAQGANATAANMNILYAVSNGAGDSIINFSESYPLTNNMIYQFQQGESLLLRGTLSLFAATFSIEGDNSVDAISTIVIEEIPNTRQP